MEPIADSQPVPHGVRLMLEAAVAGSSVRLEPVVQSDSFEFLLNYVATAETITFQIVTGLPSDGGMAGRVCRPVNPRDVPPGLLHIGQLRDQTLPVAAARFADLLASTFVREFDSD